MSKLYATLENSKGKTVSISDNNEITATLYDGNMKAYSVHIEWTDIGDIIDNDGNELPESLKTKGAIITTRDYRNREQINDKKNFICTGCCATQQSHKGFCDSCKGIPDEKR
jgi:hypothetical protein